MNIKEFSQNLLKLYDEMSESFGTFQSSTGWNCMSGCGRCCLKPDIEASAFEMIPMALRLYNENLADEWIQKLENSDTHLCPMFVPGTGLGQGKCGSYNERPSVCRMFGVAGYLNKNRETTLSICKYIRDEYKIENIPTDLSDETPIITNWTYRLASLDQRLIQDRLPLPQALLRALEKISFYAQYQSLQSD